VTSLIAALQDEDAEVRGQAAETLGRFRDARAVPALRGALKDKDKGVRRRAAKPLACVEDDRAADALIAALKDPDVEVRRPIARGLGQGGSYGSPNPNRNPNPNPNPRPNPTRIRTLTRVSAELGSGLDQVQRTQPGGTPDWRASSSSWSSRCLTEAKRALARTS